MARHIRNDVTTLARWAIRLGVPALIASVALAVPALAWLFVAVAVVVLVVNVERAIGE